VLATEAWPPIDSLRQGLRDLGYVEGQNIRFEYRYAEGRNERFAKLATDLVSLKVDVIVTWGTNAALAAKGATKAIPIVMGAIGDPVGAGVVSNLARPGGNITGLSALSAELEEKRLELLKEIAPGVSHVGVLLNLTNPYMPIAVRHARLAAQRFNVSLRVEEFRDAATLDSALDKLARAHVGALLVPADPFLVGQRRRIAQFALDNRLPSIYTFREHVEAAGGLPGYAPDYGDLFRRSATYIDKILKGAKPGDLPVEQPTKFELVINLKTAKALGLTIPPSLLQRADQVIDPSIHENGGVVKAVFSCPRFWRLPERGQSVRRRSTSHPFAHAAHDVVFDRRRSCDRRGWAAQSVNRS
jgi:putative ABC transport system substrate-binding protein